VQVAERSVQVAIDQLSDKRRGQRMVLTKQVKRYNSTDDEDVKEAAARKMADVLVWAKSVGMSLLDIAEDRDLPHRAVELAEAGGLSGGPADDAEVREAEREIAAFVDTTRVERAGTGSKSV
jgi:hypothetical protein